MNAHIYIEGGTRGPNGEGSSSKFVAIECQRAFHTLLDKMGFKARKPRLVSCGGRGRVYDLFCFHHRGQKASYVAMWIDDEEPLADIEQAWKHLSQVKTNPKWSRPDGANDDQVLFMTTSMETWIVTDRETLRRHYGQELNENPLPVPSNLENRSRKEVFQALVTATKTCKNRSEKGPHSSEVLEKLNVAVHRKHLPSFVRVERILNSKLQLTR